jgi:hypothetical protein
MNSGHILRNKRHTTPYRLKKAGVTTAVLLWCVWLFPACELINPEEPVPAYISINSFNLTVNPVVDGTASHKITDAWVYSNGSLVGVYELPCTFPVLEEGERDLIIKAGIKMNGISSARGYYPFYTNHEQRINLVAGETHTITPSVTYYPGKVHYKEGFEDGGISLEKFGVSDTNITKNATDVFEGAYSGMITIASPHDYALVATSSAYILPKNSTPVFLELNYKTNNPFKAGLFASIGGGQLEKKEVITVNKSANWNKIYINLTYACASNQNASDFKLYVEVFKETDVEPAVILLDNIKLVYN